MRIGRRGLIARVGMGSLAAWAARPRAARAAIDALAAETQATGPTLLVAGPPTGRLAQWASLLCPLIGPALMAGGMLGWTSVGAADGVTVANQFDAEVTPDGTTALLAPGAAAMAQLVGDPRARFDDSNWVATLAGVSSTVVMGLAPLSASPKVLTVQAPDPTGADLPTLLGLSLLGFKVKPVSGGWLRVIDKADVLTVSNASADALLMPRAAGYVPLFSFGTLQAGGVTQIDPAFPAMPTLQDLLLLRGLDTSRPLVTAWRALAAAKQLALVLVLPQLTPASRVAQWRQACAESIASITVQANAAAQSLRLAAEPAATALISAIAAPVNAQLELHAWMASGLGWRPS